MAAAAIPARAAAGAAARRGAGAATLRHQTGRAASVARVGRAAPAGTKRAVAGRAAETYITAKAVTPNRPRVKIRDQGGVQRPVVTSITVIMGAGFLHAWLVKKKPMPDRAFLVRMAIMGFVLALLAELTPRVGKGMAYLIMTAVIFDRSQDILKALQVSERPTERETPPQSFKQDELTPVTLYSRAGPEAAEPVLPNRNQPSRVIRNA